MGGSMIGRMGGCFANLWLGLVWSQRCWDEAKPKEKYNNLCVCG